MLAHRTWFPGLLQAAIVALSLTLAWSLHSDFLSQRGQSRVVLPLVLVALPIKMLIFALGRLNRTMWRFAGAGDMARLFAVNGAASVALAGAFFLAMGPRAGACVCGIDFLLCFVLMEGSRLTPGIYADMRANGQRANDAKRILIYGAGVAGAMLVREIRNNPSLGYKAIGFLDDDLTKRDATLLGVPVVGTGRDAARLVRESAGSSSKIAEIVIAIPSANAGQIQEIIAACDSASVPCRTIPSHRELLSGRFGSTSGQNLSADNLLGREPVQLNEDRIRSHIAGRSVLVTGAAGSIGSELCRQIARFGPRKLIAFDQAESDLFRIDLELRKSFPSLNLLAEIGDIRDPRRLADLMAGELVESVFHAAAYKHVPMMELHALEAAKNNILGTWNLVQAAYQNNVEDFLLISSDKAVRPTSVMGATKRVAELIISAMPAGGRGVGTRFVAVRFGNVLGSNGSVVPIFQAQIAAGGPVTVTHPDARRYFMTAREAVQLILQASTMGRRSEIFVLDMGEPVRIADLARRMIQLSGLTPGRDIEIQCTGLRPGEKLYEELIIEGENILPTPHEKIRVFQGQSLSIGRIEDWIERLKVLIAQSDEAAVIRHIKDLAPEYQPDGKRLYEGREALSAGAATKAATGGA
jgi:FlaA1/EpsC-like NDP-sugar epimerase